MRLIKTEICIVGAGPGGCAAALKLDRLGIPCTIVDKARFPRDKICGDAISGKVTTLMHRLDPDMLHRFDAANFHIGVWGIRLGAPDGTQFDIPFGAQVVPPSASAPGYVCRRMDFDNFLIREIKNKPQISFWEDTEIIRYERTSTGFLLYEKEGKIGFNCRLLLVADGAHSAFARKIAGLAKDPAHHAASVRAYYKGVGGTEGSSLIELHFLKSILPGYFWIFPLPDGHANVGLGIRSDVVARKRINLRKEFENLMRTHPALRERFAGAELEGIIEGYGLPLGSRQLPISGDHYMLLGDAGHLIDPLTGEGIGNAFYSGIIAAEQAQQCLDKGNFSAEFLRDYDKRVARVLGSEMNLSYRLQRLLSYPKVANTLARIMAGNSKLLGVFTRMYNDFELRLQLVNPLFWLKMWWSKKG